MDFSLDRRSLNKNIHDFNIQNDETSSESMDPIQYIIEYRPKTSETREIFRELIQKINSYC